MRFWAEDLVVSQESHLKVVKWGVETYIIILFSFVAPKIPKEEKV